MFQSKACGYAIRALERMSAVEQPGLAMVQELCEELGLPRYFVAKIFQRLVREGILISRKGRGGGFLLARPADQIKLSEVITAVDGPAQLADCPLGYGRCDGQQPCEYHDLWEPIRDQINGYLDTMTIADFAGSSRVVAEDMGVTSPCLEGLRVLIVEDSFLVGNALERMISEMGCKVMGPAPTVEAASRILDDYEVDGAVLDIEMGGVTSAPIADRLKDQNRPFFFISGYGNLEMLPPGLRSYRRLSKPIGEALLRSALMDEICVG